MRAEPQQRIHNKALRVWRITGALTSILYWLIPAVYIIIHQAFGLLGWLIWVLLGAALLLTVIHIWLIPSIRWQRWRYEVQEHEIDLKRGIFIIQRTLIPIIRIQHVDTQEGPLLRKYGLASVTISTAAGLHEIPALSSDVADELRDRISHLARMADEDV